MSCFVFFQPLTLSLSLYFFFFSLSLPPWGPLFHIQILFILFLQIPHNFVWHFHRFSLSQFPSKCILHISIFLRLIIVFVPSIQKNPSTTFNQMIATLYFSHNNCIHKVIITKPQLALNCNWNCFYTHQKHTHTHTDTLWAMVVRAPIVEIEIPKPLSFVSGSFAGKNIFGLYEKGRRDREESNLVIEITKLRPLKKAIKSRRK